MSNLSDLYISASYYGVVNLSDATEPFVSQSEAKIYLHDGVGENLGIWFNSEKRVHIDNGLTVTGSTILSGSVDIIGNKTITGSLSVDGIISSSTYIYAPSASFDTVHARKLHILIESSSTIFNSGSNIFGDEPTDTQVLSGSVYVPNLHYLAGNPKDTNLRINEKLSTSSFDSFSSSLHTQQLQQDQNLIDVSSSFAVSQGVQDSRLNSIEIFTSSLEADFVTDVEYSASIAVVTSSLQSQIDTKLPTNTFTLYSGSVNQYQQQQDNRIDALVNATGSYAKLAGGNTFTGTQTINDDLYVNGTTTAFNNDLISVNGRLSLTGSMDITGSVQGVVIPLTITSETASMDCSLGNFFTLNLPTGSIIHIVPTNIQPGLTITLQIKQDPNGIGNVDFNSEKFDFPRIALPSVTPQNGAKDILTFVSFDNQVLNGVISNDMI